MRQNSAMYEGQSNNVSSIWQLRSHRSLSLAYSHCAKLRQVLESAGLDTVELANVVQHSATQKLFNDAV
jgi:hypothetical protein